MEGRPPGKLKRPSNKLFRQDEELKDASKASILPLPHEVVAQIKSSTTITSLVGVVLSLLQNSFDASATKISVDVDFTRGNATVEDNGHGIVPSEFAETGGLGKLYHTSKYARSTRNSNQLYGTNGTFLASLGAMCLLTITSKHHRHYSTNSLITHFSKVKSRFIPAPAAHRLENGDQGTRVVVRDLFGNMAVRVKQRGLLAEDGAELDRLWEELKGSVTALLVAFGSPVSVRLRDVVSGRHVSISPPLDSATTTSMLSSRQLLILNTLYQAGKITSRNSGSWIPASASSKALSVKGMICLDPSPTKSIQYLSLGILPLLKSNHASLYEHINKLFARSHFGALPEDEISEQERFRRQNDRRFKVDGLTRKQMLVEKGVDRWPMFVLKIEFKDGMKAGEDDVFRAEGSVNAITQVLDALVTSWLEAHHFRPRKQGARQTRPVLSADYSISSGVETTEDDARAVLGAQASVRPRSSIARPYSGVQINSLSRIKSSRGMSFERPDTKEHRPGTAPSGTVSPAKRSFINVEMFSSEWPKKGQATRPETAQEPQELRGSHSGINELNESANVLQDEIIDWTDPVTKQKHRINARTGMLVPGVQAIEARRNRTPNQNLNPEVHARPSSRLSLPSRPGVSPAVVQQPTTGWLDAVLDNFNNPVFRTREQPIAQSSFDIPFTSESRVHQCMHLSKEMDQAFGEVSRLNASKISKAALRRAKVIAQVDEKFILVRLDGREEGEQGLLVAVDQHAADERIKVEQLLEELCSPPDVTYAHIASQTTSLRSAVKTTMLEKPLKFSVSSHESVLFAKHAAYFAAWGILYDLLNSTEAEHHIVVLSLPPLIAERCTTNPKLLISLLRSEVWRREEAGKSIIATTPISASTDKGSWIKRIACCPPELLNMINSRACRSAIMFNDKLSIHECENLIKKLSECKFPFMCAHGRPSMVPLIELGSGEDDSLGYMGIGLRHQEEDEEEAYAGAFVSWKKSLEVGDYSDDIPDRGPI